MLLPRIMQNESPSLLLFVFLVGLDLDGGSAPIDRKIDRSDRPCSCIRQRENARIWSTIAAKFICLETTNTVIASSQSNIQRYEGLGGFRFILVY